VDRVLGVVPRQGVRGALCGVIFYNIYNFLKTNNYLQVVGLARKSRLCVRTCEHQLGRLLVTTRTVRAPDGPWRPAVEPDGWSSVVPITEDHDPHDSQAFLAMRLLTRVFRSTGEIEGARGDPS